MDTDIQAVLTARLIDAIRKSFSPCPLIGPKWFHFSANGKPADMQFVGAGKLAKATSFAPQVVAEMVVKNLDLKGMEADVHIRRDAAIVIRLKNRPGAAKSAETTHAGKAGKDASAAQGRADRPPKLALSDGAGRTPPPA